MNVQLCLTKQREYITSAAACRNHIRFLSAIWELRNGVLLVCSFYLRSSPGVTIIGEKEAEVTARQVKLANGCPKHLPSGTYRVIRSDEGLTLEKSASKTFYGGQLTLSNHMLYYQLS